MISIHVKDADAQKMLEQLASKIKDIRPVYMDFGAHMERSIQKNFDAQGRPVRWKPLKPMTLFSSISQRKTYYKGGRFTAAGRKALTGRKVLTDTARLRNSIHSTATSQNLRIYTNVEYAAIHQFGGKTRPHKITAKNAKALLVYPFFFKSVNHPGSNIPARPFLLVQAEDWTYLKNRIAQFLAGEK
jgi:phage virion morphogenesis protein